MKAITITSSILILALAGCEPTTELETLDQRASYAFGQNVYNNLNMQGVTLDNDLFIKGYQDAATGKEPALSPEDATAVMRQYQQQLMHQKKAEMEAIGDTNLKEGDAFLAENAKKDGVVVTKSGLQYKVIKSGSGKTPTADDTVVTHYRGTLIDGREFDSSYTRNQPATFPVKGVIAGWTEALQLMKEGDKWELYVPSMLAYGETQRSELITPNATLVFEIELLEVK